MKNTDPKNTNSSNSEDFYSFNTFENQDEEFKRLVLQASIVESLELSFLKKAGLKDGDFILDVGSGPGTISSMLAKNFPKSKVIGVEPEESLISKAVDFTKAQKLDNRCTYAKGLADSIPVDDNTFDFAYIRLLLQHIENPSSIFKELQRVVKPGGIVCILDVDDGLLNFYPDIPEWHTVEQLCQQSQATYGGDRRIGRKLFATMRDAKFKNVQAQLLSISMQDLGRENFFEILFGFKKELLLRIDQWNEENQNIFKQLKETILDPNTFAMTTAIVASGEVCKTINS
jgi:ubiquinone/menaquinone biosynthesis C-methylase UbiE